MKTVICFEMNVIIFFLSFFFCDLLCKLELDERSVIDKSALILILDKSAFLSQNKVFSLQEFMNLFRKQIAREVIQTFQKELSEEINQRTSALSEMIPGILYLNYYD